jgi:hypothetical protein
MGRRLPALSGVEASREEGDGISGSGDGIMLVLRLELVSD